MAGTIKALEIFAAGMWSPSTGGTYTWTEADLDTMVENFNALAGTNIVKPHLKLGHTDGQKWFGQKNGVPTLGWIERVWRDGKKLMADVTDVPMMVIDLIRQGRYHNISAEIFPANVIEHNGKKLGAVLSAVALLGTEMPAVRDLAGLAAALFANSFTSVVETAPTNFTRENLNMFNQEQVDALIAAAVTKALATATSDHAAEIASQATELTVVTARAESAETKLATMAAEFAAKEVTVMIDDAIKAGKLLPKQREMTLSFMNQVSGSSVVKFGGVDKTPVQMFADLIGAMGKQVDLKENGSGKNTSNAETFETSAQEVDVKTREMVAGDPTRKLAYADAFRAVLAADPDLANRYVMGSN